MSMDKDSKANIFLVAGVLCLVCSLCVSVAAVSLRGLQQKNALNEMRVNVLRAAHMISGKDKPTNKQIEDDFAKIDTVVIDLKNGKIDSSVDPDKFDMRVASKDPQMSRALTGDHDPAGIKRQPNQAKIYLVKENDKIARVVLPVNGYGLWSTMYGFVAVTPDGQKIEGISFYDQQETPGLGGEISNPNWQALWKSVQIYSQAGTPNVKLVKNANKANEVDSLAGASLTSRGVQHMINFWMSSEGYKPFLDNLAKNDI